MIVVFDHEQFGDPLHAHETTPGHGAVPIESDTAVIGELQKAMRRLGIGADHAGMHALRRRIDVFAADFQDAAAASADGDGAAGMAPAANPVTCLPRARRLHGVRLADGSQPTVQR